MSNRPDNLVRRVTGVANFMPDRSRTPSERTAPAWPFAPGKNRHAKKLATPHHLVGTAYNAGPWPFYAEAQTDGKCPGADFNAVLEPFGRPAVPRVRRSYRRQWVARIANWETLGYTGRLLSFNLVVISAHLAALRWIFLPIGG